MDSNRVKNLTSTRSTMCWLKYANINFYFYGLEKSLFSSIIVEIRFLLAKTMKDIGKTFRWVPVPVILDQH